jgi:hypothetical protein
MNNIDKYPIRGLVQCAIEKSMTIDEVVDRINLCFSQVEQRVKAEAKLEIIHGTLESSQRDRRAVVSHTNEFLVRSEWLDK